MPLMPVNPNTTRARLMLEVASELVGAPLQGFAQAEVTLTPFGQSELAPTRLRSHSTIDSIEAVLSRQTDFAIINPATALAMAVRGVGPYSAPLPLRAIAVIPSEDQFVFAVRQETGLTSFEEIVARRIPLRVSLRGQPDHCLHTMLDQVLVAAGFSLEAIKSWGGVPKREGTLPWPDSAKFKALAQGEIDAIFDEASYIWVNEALDAGATILPLAETTVRKLEATGFRRAFIRKSQFPKLAADVLTVDFSGWPVFCHADASDDLVRQVCAGLDARKDSIPGEDGKPLPVERMCREAPDTPQDVPLHPAAERYWRERGYLG
jgi:TRAP-type uncharacterized transport system substrate-binding protein